MKLNDLGQFGDFVRCTRCNAAVTFSSETVNSGSIKAGNTNHHHFQVLHLLPLLYQLFLVSPLGGTHLLVHLMVQLRLHFLLFFSFQLLALVLLFPAGVFLTAQLVSSVFSSVSSFCFWIFFQPEILIQTKGNKKMLNNYSQGISQQIHLQYVYFLFENTG